jgi:hypothetical protein
MADARQNSEWNHTAQLLSLIANANRDPKRSRAFTPDDFHPFKLKEKHKPDKLRGQECRDALRAFVD